VRAEDFSRHEESIMTSPAQSTVVVAVDGTQDGERAVLYGATLASREDLDLRLVHVPHEVAVYAPMMPYLPATTVREIGEAVLREAAKHAEETGLDGQHVTTVLAKAPRATGLLDNVQDARCVVLGTRASALRHLFTGATSVALAAHSPVPVHCVPRAWADHRSRSSRIVVGLDGSNADHEVLEEAFREASARHATLEVVHAWRPVSPYDAAITERVLRDHWDSTTRAEQTRRVEVVASGHPAVRWMLRLEFERVPEALHEASVNADLLVLGRHGHDAPLGLLVGSNTRTLLHTATCPVVVVPVPPARSEAADRQVLLGYAPSWVETS
jgi:nucleotide-binding universal stress UspA family protein